MSGIKKAITTQKIIKIVLLLFSFKLIEILLSNALGFLFMFIFFYHFKFSKTFNLKNVRKKYGILLLTPGLAFFLKEQR